MNEWLDENSLLEILPSYIVERLLRDTYYCNFTGDPVVPANELGDLVALAQRDLTSEEQ